MLSLLNRIQFAMIPEAPKFIKIMKIMIGIRYFFLSIFAKNTAHNITKINAGGN